MKSLKTIIGPRYIHLCLGLFALYGVSWIFTYTTRFEKIVDSLRYYCWADYEVRTSLFSRERMVADRDLQFQPGYRYLRALFTGLSLEPNYTMFYLSRQYHHYNPYVNKVLQEFKQRLGVSDPDEITLDQISKTAQEILKKLEYY